MKFEEYVAHINRLYHNRPELKDLEVVHARDDEGNGYLPVHFHPTPIRLDDDGEPDMSAELTQAEPNRVCIN